MLVTIVADPGCLSRIRIFPSRIQDQKDSRSRIRIRIRIKELIVFLTPKIVSKISEILSGMFIPDPDLAFLPIPDPGVKKDTGSRIQIRITARDNKYVRYTQIRTWQFVSLT
jgi:hypothetical protein